MSGGPEVRQQTCVTIGCGNPAMVTGTFHAPDRDFPGTAYCTGCADLVGAVFVPDPGRPTVRQQLAEEIGRHQGLRGPMDDERPDVWQNRCVCGWDDGDERTGGRERYRLHIADALMAHVDRIAAERAAEALREAAWVFDCETVIEVPDWLYARAEAMAAGRQETT